MVVAVSAVDVVLPAVVVDPVVVERRRRTRSGEFGFWVGDLDGLAWMRNEREGYMGKWE